MMAVGRAGRAASHACPALEGRSGMFHKKHSKVWRGHNGQLGAGARGQQRPAQGVCVYVDLCVRVSHPRSSSFVCSSPIPSAVFLSEFAPLPENTFSTSPSPSVSSARSSASPPPLPSSSPASLQPTSLPAMTLPRSCPGVYLCPSFFFPHPVQSPDTPPA